MKKIFLSLTLLLTFAPQLFAQSLYELLQQDSIRVTILRRKLENLIRSNDMSEIEEVIEKDKNLLNKDVTRVGYTILYYACFKNNKKLFDLVFPHCNTKTINCNTKGLVRYYFAFHTPLHSICCRNNPNIDIIKALLSKSTSNNISYYINFHTYVTCLENTKLFKLLLLNGGKPNEDKPELELISEYEASEDKATFIWDKKQFYTVKLNNNITKHITLDIIMNIKNYQEINTKLQQTTPNIPDWAFADTNENEIFDFLIALCFSRSIEEVLENKKRITETDFFKFCQKYYDRVNLAKLIEKAKKDIYRLDMKDMARSFEEIIEDYLPNNLQQSKVQKKHWDVKIRCAE